MSMPVVALLSVMPAVAHISQEPKLQLSGCGSRHCGVSQIVAPSGTPTSAHTSLQAKQGLLASIWQYLRHLTGFPGRCCLL